MTPEEIIEGNKLIAEFMGYEKHPTIEDCLRDPQKSEHNFMHPSHLKYHSSWDWLMPVIEKISHSHIIDEENPEHFDTYYPRTFGMLSEETGQPMFRFNCGGLFIADTLIEAAWLATIDFIKSEQPLTNKP